MKLSKALKGFSFNLEQSQRSKYEDSDINIMFLKLDAEYHGQDYLVMSKTSATYFLDTPEDEQKAFLADCEVSYSEDADTYGVTMPQSTKTLGSFSF